MYILAITCGETIVNTGYDTIITSLIGFVGIMYHCIIQHISLLVVLSLLCIL